jgi:Ni,Fe-hydrogenase maturation factor
MADLSRTLLIGIGNSGRADDGLGWAFLDEVEKTLPKNYDLEYRYQLQVEDAELISHYNTVFFIDAHKKN